MDERIQVYETKMGKTLNALESELTTIRAGRANPHILDKLTVDYYGAPTPIQQVANISVPEARMIQIQPWESSMIKAIAVSYTHLDVYKRQGSLRILCFLPMKPWRRNTVPEIIRLYTELMRTRIRKRSKVF